MNRRRFILASSAFLTGCALVRQKTQLAPNSTLIITRHADRNGEDLNTTGLTRAKALVKALDGQPLDAIYSPDLKRNMDTAEPLSQARSLLINTRPAENPAGQLAREGAGKAVIWIGNKGNIKAIWEQLNLPAPMPLNYGDLHILRSDASGSLTIDRRRYGP